MSLKEASEDELDLEQSLLEDEGNESTSNWKPIDQDALELDTLETASEKEKTEVGPKG